MHLSGVSPGSQKVALLCMIQKQLMRRCRARASEREQVPASRGSHSRQETTLASYSHTNNYHIVLTIELNVKSHQEKSEKRTFMFNFFVFNKKKKSMLKNINLFYFIERKCNMQFKFLYCK